MPWIRFELGKGAIEESEKDVYLRGRKKELENDTPLSENFAIFESVDEHNTGLTHENFHKGARRPEVEGREAPQHKEVNDD